MCCTFAEYTTCQSCSKRWNHELQTINCINQYCRTTYKPRPMPPMVSYDRCLPCKLCARRKWRNEFKEKAEELVGHRTLLQVPQRAKLTPLFWDARRCQSDDKWTSKDKDRTTINACNTTKGLLNSLVRLRESRFKELWEKSS